jgi:hypothetical protein
MARTTYQIVLSTDGTHKLTASTDDPAELKNAMDHLKNTYKWMEYFIQQGELHKIKDVVTMNRPGFRRDSGHWDAASRGGVP